MDMLCSFGAGSLFAISVHGEGQDDTSTAMAADDEDALVPAQNFYNDFSLYFQTLPQNPNTDVFLCIISVSALTPYSLEKVLKDYYSVDDTSNTVFSPSAFRH